MTDTLALSAPDQPRFTIGRSPSVIHYLLRAEKEGVGIDDIAMVFD